MRTKKVEISHEKPMIFHNTKIYGDMKSEGSYRNIRTASEKMDWYDDFSENNDSNDSDEHDDYEIDKYIPKGRSS